MAAAHHDLLPRALRACSQLSPLPTRATAEGKDTAVTMFWDGRIKPFHMDRYTAGHRATDYKKWLTAVKPYRVRYEEGFEPYVLVARKFVPWYDERFVGYRKNKVVHLLHLAQTGMQFIIHPRAFTVHAPHPRARTWKATHKTGLWDQVRAAPGPGWQSSAAYPR